jgi:hypothetical protein
MLCKIWGFHCDDYEECRLLRYKTPVLTSQETHYVSATEPSRLILCKISDIHGGDYEECRLLGCYAVWLLYEPTFQRNISPPSSGWQESACFGCYCVFFVHRFLSPWWWRRYVPPERRFLQEPHGVTSQKTTFFIVTAVKPSNLT